MSGLHQSCGTATKERCLYHVGHDKRCCRQDGQLATTFFISIQSEKSTDWGPCALGLMLKRLNLVCQSPGVVDLTSSENLLGQRLFQHHLLAKHGTAIRRLEHSSSDCGDGSCVELHHFVVECDLLCHSQRVLNTLVREDLLQQVCGVWRSSWLRG